MMRILLIAPTALDYGGRPITQRRLHLPALTLPQLAAATPPEAEVRLVYETVEKIPFEEQWDLVGLTGMGSGIVRAWQIADRFRARGIRVVIGGIAASLGDPELTLAHADALVVGEGDEIWPQVVRDAAAGRLQRMYSVERRPPLNGLPVPRYDLMNRATLGFWRPVQATRGCGHTCRFCSTTAFSSHTHRKRPIPEVVRDVRAARRAGSHHIAFMDDNIGFDPDYCRELLEALVPERIIWMSQCTLQITDRPELVKLAYRSGCRMFSVGIESTREASLVEIGKEWNKPGRYAEAFGILRRSGIDVSTEMVVGLDEDDPSVFDTTFRFIQENHISVPRVHIVTPVPGTPFFERMKEEGRLLHTDFSRYTGGQAVFRPRWCSPEDLQRGYWELYTRLFTWKAILHRIGRNRAGLGPIMRGVVWGANIHYRTHVRRRICPGIV
jgi:radical SAM superfamily enzyme YgiQ (UPF0313 family)